GVQTCALPISPRGSAARVASLQTTPLGALRARVSSPGRRPPRMRAALPANAARPCPQPARRARDAGLRPSSGVAQRTGSAGSGARRTGPPRCETVPSQKRSAAATSCFALLGAAAAVCLLHRVVVGGLEPQLAHHIRGLVVAELCLDLTHELTTHSRILAQTELLFQQLDLLLVERRCARKRRSHGADLLRIGLRARLVHDQQLLV